MHIKKLKVRAKKAGFETLCAPQLASMLGCWAAKKDLTNMGDCKEAAMKLHECMAATRPGANRQRSTINYHLARLQKVLK